MEEEIFELDEITFETVAKKLNISVCEASNLCMKLVERGLLEMFFDIICPKCKSTAGTYKSLIEIPDEVKCVCGNVFMPMRENIKVYFRRKS